MGLFDWLKKRKKNTSSVIKEESSLQAEGDVRPAEGTVQQTNSSASPNEGTTLQTNSSAPLDEGTVLQTNLSAPPDEETVKALRLRGMIVDVDRRGGGPERTLTVLFYNSHEYRGIPVGYFCVQQCSGAYSGAGFRYMFLPKDISKPKAADYVEHDGYSGFITGFFSENFEMDLHGTKRLVPIDLPEILWNMSFSIEMKKPGTSVDGCLLEMFQLCKATYGRIYVDWVVSSRHGYASGSDPVPAEFFRNHDLNGFARYMVEKYKFLECTADEIFRNQEIWTLFELLREP